jgi:hypothetical protein
VYTVYPKTLLGTTAAEEYLKGRPDTIIDVCEGDRIELIVEVLGYLPDITYQWYKDDVAIPRANDSTYVIASGSASSVGKYYVTVTSHCETKTSLTYNVKVRVPVVFQRYDKVMLLVTNPNDNGGYVFSNIRWYVDGSEVEEARGLSYYFEAGGVAGHTYYVVANTPDGGTYVSCPRTGEVYTRANISLYPNPVKAGGELIISHDGITGITVQLLTTDGHILLSKKASGVETKFTAPNTPGVYIVRIISTNGSDTAAPLVELKVIVN